MTINRIQVEERARTLRNNYYIKLPDTRGPLSASRDRLTKAFKTFVQCNMHGDEGTRSAFLRLVHAEITREGNASALVAYLRDASKVPAPKFIKEDKVKNILIRPDLHHTSVEDWWAAFTKLSRTQRLYDTMLGKHKAHMANYKSYGLYEHMYACHVHLKDNYKSVVDFKKRGRSGHVWGREVTVEYFREVIIPAFDGHWRYSDNTSAPRHRRIRLDTKKV